MLRKNAKKKDNNHYDMEVTEDDKEKISIKIHFVFYGNEFNEWRVFDIDQLPLFCPGHLSALKLKYLCSRRTIVRRQKANVSRQFIKSD